MCTNFERNLPTVNLSLLLASLFTLLGATLHSEPDCVVDSNVGRVETTPEAVHARLRVFGGKEVEIRWQIPDASFVDGKPIALQVHRVTSARRISIAADELKPGHLTWKWEVPVPKWPPFIFWSRQSERNGRKIRSSRGLWQAAF